MQTTSATYDRILAGTDISYETQLVIDDVGTYGESDLMSISTSIEMFQEDPDIGKAIASEINVVMLNPVLPIPTMARIRPQVKAKGIAPKSSKVTIVDEDLASEYASYSSENITFSTASGATVVGESLTFAVDSTEYLESEWLAQGIFYIDTREITANNNGLDILTIHGFDAMLKTEQIYSSNETVGDAPDISYVRAIADAIGVEVDPRTWVIMGTGYTIPFPVGYSMREILGYIASAYAGCFIISDIGQLRLVALEDIEDETRYLIDEIGEILVFGVDSPQHTVTASGAIASFTAGGDYALDELEIAIEPVQSGSGDPSPSNIRPISGWTGCDIWQSHGNLFDASTSTTNRYLANDGTLKNSTVSCVTAHIPVSSLKEYYLDTPNYDGNARNIGFYHNDTWLGYVQYNSVPYTIHPIIGATSMRVTYLKGSSTYIADASCIPISWSDNLINQDGTNTENGYVHNAYINTSGTVSTAQGSWDVLEYVPVNPSTTYTLSGVTANNANGYAEYNESKTMVGHGNVNVSPFTLTTGANTRYVRFNRQYSTDTQVMLNKGSTALPFEQYNAVYKGTLNVKTGVLTVDWSSFKISDKTWTYDSQYTRFVSTVVSDVKRVTNARAIELYCSAYMPIYDRRTVASVPNNAIYFGATSSDRSAYIKTDAYTDPTAFVTAMGDTQVIYPLNTTKTYQLDSHTVQTLVGQNNLWANTGNIINLEFTEPASEAVRILV